MTARNVITTITAAAFDIIFSLLLLLLLLLSAPGAVCSYCVPNTMRRRYSI